MTQLEWIIGAVAIATVSGFAALIPILEYWDVLP